MPHHPVRIPRSLYSKTEPFTKKRVRTLGTISRVSIAPPPYPRAPLPLLAPPAPAPAAAVAVAALAAPGTLRISIRYISKRDLYLPAAVLSATSGPAATAEAARAWESKSVRARRDRAGRRLTAAARPAEPSLAAGLTNA